MARKRTNKPRRDIEQEVTDRILELLEGGSLKWRRTWATRSGAGTPTNAFSKKAYRGGNAFWLACIGGPNSRWATFNQIKKAEGEVRKGSKSAPVIFWKFLPKKDKKGKPILNSRGKPETFPILRYFNVFDVDTQVDWPEGSKFLAEPEPVREVTEDESYPEAEAFVQALVADAGLVINHGGDRAFYMPSTDQVTLPKPESFESLAYYHAVQCHEIVHWTGGSADRSKRDLGGSFGDNKYAGEELVAELGAAYLCAHLGVAQPDQPDEQHAAYLQSWIKNLKDDKKAFWRASSAAQRAVDYLLEAAGMGATNNDEAAEEAA